MDGRGERGCWGAEVSEVVMERGRGPLGRDEGMTVLFVGVGGDKMKASPAYNNLLGYLQLSLVK